MELELQSQLKVVSRARDYMKGVHDMMVVGSVYQYLVLSCGHGSFSGPGNRKSWAI